MRLIVVLIVMVSTSGAVAAGETSTVPITLPTYDIASTCRTQVDYAYAATLGQLDVPRELEACAVRERDQRGSVEALWPLASDADRNECLGIADKRYNYLARCLADSRSVRASR